MKMLIAAIVCLCSISSSIAQEVTDRDGVVRSLRKEFAAAKAPKGTDLQFGRDWECKSVFTGHGDDGVHDWFLSLSPFGGSVRNEGDPSLRRLVYTSSGLVGKDSAEENGAVYVVRVSSKGDLLVEYSMPKGAVARSGIGTRILTPAVYDSTFVGIAYAICPVH